MTSPLPAHGVLIQLENTGIYLIGKSSVGKSETALQLIAQGAKLICDDAPELTPGSDDSQLLGICPKGFYGLMHVRDLGIINIIELFGQNAFNNCHAIDFVIELIDTESIETDCLEFQATILEPEYQQWQYQSWTIPGISLHLYANRNIALLIKMAVLQFNKNNKKSRETEQ